MLFFLANMEDGAWQLKTDNFGLKIDEFVISSTTVMPDLIRHPEYTEITGFWLPDLVQDRLHRNDASKRFQTF